MKQVEATVVTQEPSMGERDQLAFAIRDAEYDAQFEQVVKAFVYIDGDENVVRAITGVKDRSTKGEALPAWAMTPRGH